MPVGGRLAVISAVTTCFCWVSLLCCATEMNFGCTYSQEALCPIPQPSVKMSCPTALPSPKGPGGLRKVTVVPETSPGHGNQGTGTTRSGFDSQGRCSRHDGALRCGVPHLSGQLLQARPACATTCEEWETHNLTVPCGGFSVED